MFNANWKPSGKRTMAAWVLLTTGVMASAEGFAAATLATGADAAATLKAGARLRNFPSGGGVEVWVFDGLPAADTTGQLTWGASQTVTVAYNAAADVLSATVGATVTSRNVGDLGSLNYLEITVTKNGSSTSIGFNSISLNAGASLGNTGLSGSAGTSKWKITGADLTSGFTLSGTLGFVGLMGGGDSNFVQVEVGYVEPPDDEGPVISSVAVQPTPVLVNGEATVTANVDDSGTGNNDIQSAEYSLNSGAWSAMAAQDGSFDEPDEDVTASFTATQLGGNEVCVRGTDAVGNTGDAVCQVFLVTYAFTGFFQPIDNGYVNVVKAGQAIPAKWRLSDANDNPISEFSSFDGLFSYPISCTDFAGDPTDGIEEVASGSSGLQYSGDGYWQFNWKTDKQYGNYCRAMYVQFDSGATSPVVKFSFKK